MARSVTSSQASRLSTVASIAFAVAALYVAQEVLVPIALSVLLAFLLAPLVGRLQRVIGRRTPAVLAVVAIAFSFIGLIGYVVGQQVVDLAQDFPSYQKEVSQKYERIRVGTGGWGTKLKQLSTEYEKATAEPATRASAPVPAASPEPTVIQHAAQEFGHSPFDAAAREVAGTTVPPVRGPVGSSEANPFYAVALPAPVSPLKTLGQYLGLVLGPLGTAALVLVFVVFILLEREDLRDRLIRVVSHGRYTVTTRAIDDAGTRISRYMLAQSVVNGSYGVIIGVGLCVIGLTVGHGVIFPSFVLWGLLSATLRFIPYIGAWIAASFPLVLSLAVYPGFSVFAAVVVLLVGIELITNNVMEPWLYAASTGLSTMAILIAAVFWTWLWGPVGLLLSTPLTVCIVVLGKHVTQLNFLDVLLSDQAALPPAVSFYQRLLAGDRLEAVSVAKQIAQERGGDRVGDDVLIPTLIMARRDRRDDDLSVEKENTLLEQMKLVLPQLRAKQSTPSPIDASQPKLRILGIPSHHRAEEIPLELLSDLLGAQGIQMDAVTTRMLPSEIEQKIEQDRPSVLYIAVLPPGGVVQARYLCRRLHRRFADLKIVIAYWGKPRNFDQLLVRFRGAGASYVTTSLLQSRSQILALLSRPAVSTPPAPVIAST